jgi:hypothetical protein
MHGAIKERQHPLRINCRAVPAQHLIPRHYDSRFRARRSSFRRKRLYGQRPANTARAQESSPGESSLEEIPAAAVARCAHPRPPFA